MVEDTGEGRSMDTAEYSGTSLNHIRTPHTLCSVPVSRKRDVNPASSATFYNPFL